MRDIVTWTSRSISRYKLFTSAVSRPCREPSSLRTSSNSRVRIGHQPARDRGAVHAVYGPDPLDVETVDEVQAQERAVAHYQPLEAGLERPVQVREVPALELMGFLPAQDGFRNIVPRSQPVGSFEVQRRSRGDHPQPVEQAPHARVGPELRRVAGEQLEANFLLHVVDEGRGPVDPGCRRRRCRDLNVQQGQRAGRPLERRRNQEQVVGPLPELRGRPTEPAAMFLETVKS